MKIAGATATLVAVLVALSCGGPSDRTPAPRHLIYLHGRIVQEQQSDRPVHPRYGPYELEEILSTFRARGFAVTGEIRPRSASVSESADRVVAEIRRLIESGVPADRITVVGASMGAGIALVASARLQRPEVRFCLLGACLSQEVDALVSSGGQVPSGRLLSIREASDESTAGCPPWRADPREGGTLVVRELVLDTGLSHGFLYRPLPGWVDPVVAWATAGETSE